MIEIICAMDNMSICRRVIMVGTLGLLGISGAPALAVADSAEQPVESAVVEPTTEPDAEIQAVGYWKFYNTATHDCLTAGDAGTAYVDACNGSARQNWSWIGEYHGPLSARSLKNQKTGECLTSENEGPRNRVWTSPCAAGSNQRWVWESNDNIPGTLGLQIGGYLRTSPNRAGAVYNGQYYDYPEHSTWKKISS